MNRDVDLVVDTKEGFESDFGSWFRFSVRAWRRRHSDRER